MTEKRIENEFSRIFNLGLIKKNGSEIEYLANEDECQKLAERFSIPKVTSLKARCKFLKLGEKDFGDYCLHVDMEANIIQQCVLTLNDVQDEINEKFSIIFKRKPSSDLTLNQEKEIDFEADEEDIIFFEDIEVDVGELIAEYLSLAMNPYPRLDRVDTDKLGYQIVSEDQLTTPVEKKNPFEVLKDLKHKT